MFFSMIILFPFLNEFRYYYSEKDINFIPDISFFNHSHFDAYQNFMEVIRLNYITFGEQILVVGFFFIPRSIWENKPIGSGAQMALDNDYVFTNISMPFIAEGYVNFGYIGVFIFLYIFSFLMRQIDFKYLTHIELSSNSYSVAKGIFFCAAIFFISRGDLLSSFAFIFYGNEIFSIFVPEVEAYTTGGRYLTIDGYSQIFMMIEITTQGMFYGVGRSLPPAIISIGCNYFRIPLSIFLISLGMGLDGIWWSISITSIMKGIICIIWLYLIRKKLYISDQFA